MDEFKDVNLKEEVEVKNNSKKEKKKRTNTGILIILLIIDTIIIVTLLWLLLNKNIDNSVDNNIQEGEVKESQYKISGSSLGDFDLQFLKLENKKENKIYSPLSIKYALEMLSDGADGNSRDQISSIIGDYRFRNYVNSANMSFANAIFIKEAYKDTVKSEYLDKLKERYNASVIFDSFQNPDNINSWISERTLGLIKKAVNQIEESSKFMLVNALGIDMEWREKFISYKGSARYLHENFYWMEETHVVQKTFDNAQKVSGMDIKASLNNYDIVKELGEDKIRETVGNEYRKWLLNSDNEFEKNRILNGDFSEENINKEINRYLDEYIKDINSNYKKNENTTDFLLYVDNDVKAFAKDLKEYNGITLQYVGIMPTQKDLEQYIKDTDSKSISTIISSLKELKLENFKDGVVTKITGFIPKFKFDYQLDLKNDLNQLGITDVFDKNKANLTNITSIEDIFVEEATHKANIEFTQDGIKASAATIFGGGGGGGGFDYIYDIPIEEIDLTFDKPYMFLIRDKATGEVWFTGTVYNPLNWEDEPEKDKLSYLYQ